MKTFSMLRIAPLATLALLAACNSGPENSASAPPTDQDAMGVAPPSAAPVTLPPALLASRTYRCKDNSLVYVDFYSDNVSADLRAGTKDAQVVKLTAPAAGQPLAAEGYTVSGSGPQVSITQPGKGSQSCKA